MRRGFPFHSARVFKFDVHLIEGVLEFRAYEFFTDDNFVVGFRQLFGWRRIRHPLDYFVNMCRCDLSIRGSFNGLLPSNELLIGREKGKGTGLGFGGWLDVANWRHHINNIC